MSSRKQKRISALVELVGRQSGMHIRDAAEALKVSEMTIRRDIQANPDKFEYLGGHIVPADQLARRTPYDLGLEADVHESEKYRACQLCLPHLVGEQTIFVDCGTTLVHLMDLLPAEHKITIVCNAMNVADRVIRKPEARLIMVGGEYHSPTSSFYGLEAETLFAQLGIGTGFFSAAGIHAEIGATCSHFREIRFKQAAMASSRRRILVADSSKIGRVESARYAAIEAFDLIITERGEQRFDESGH